MKHALIATAGVLGFTMGSSADIVVQTYSNTIFPGGVLEGAPIEWYFDGWSHADTIFIELSIRSLNNPSSQAALLARSDNDDTRVFHEGQFVSTAGPVTESYRWMRITHNYEFGETYYSDDMGEIGGDLYLGFTFDRDVGGGETVRNAGFLQLYRASLTEYQLLGFAYDTVADGGIQVFNLVPAPSAAVAMLFSACFAARRRR